MQKKRSVMTTELTSRGFLQVHVVSMANNFPIPGATVAIANEEEPNRTLEQLPTNSSGNTEHVALAAPPPAYSLTPASVRPYSRYSLKITAPGFKPAVITGTEVLPDVNGIQPVRLEPESGPPAAASLIHLPDHALYGAYPPKIPEAELQPVGGTDEVVRKRVTVPQTVVVHDGVPADASAVNYYVPYRDYLKNVASGIVYATWPQAAIEANVLAIMSFTMNRVYTEHYRNRGYDFTITSSTAFDHMWVYGRNIYGNISVIVDELFDHYLSRPEVRQPVLTQYCDGRRVRCLERGWLTQWDSCSLGERGDSPVEILRHFYGENLYINVAEEIAGVPSSWPGYDLTMGAFGRKVRQLQEQLEAIAGVYPAVPRVTPDGVYGPATAAAVKEFQTVFGLTVTGVVDFAAWFKIASVYVGISGRK